MTLESLLLVAGILHFALLPVSLSVPRVLDWKRQLSLLTPLCRQVIWVHGVFVAGMIVTFGALTLILAPRIAAGREPVLAAIMAGFWLARLAIQLVYLNPRHWPKAWWSMPGRYALTALFTFWAAVYAIVFLIH